MFSPLAIFKTFLALLLVTVSFSIAAPSCAATSSTSPYSLAASSNPGLLPGGFTRARTGRGFHLLAPENRVFGAGPAGWTGGASAAAVVTPALGAHFAMYIVHAPGGAKLDVPTTFPGALRRLERFFFVLEGLLAVRGELVEEGSLELGPGGFLYVAPGDDGVQVLDTSGGGVVLVQIDRIYSGNEEPKSVLGETEKVDAEVPAGDKFRLRRLLNSGNSAYDFNIHIMDFSPGEYLAVKEVWSPVLLLRHTLCEMTSSEPS